MRKRTTMKNGKLVASVNTDKDRKVKYYDKKESKKEDILSPPISRLQTKKSL